MKIEKKNPMLVASPLADIGRSISDAMDVGVFPVSGGLLHQPARAIRLARLWKSAFCACEWRANARRM